MHRLSWALLGVVVGWALLLLLEAAGLHVATRTFRRAKEASERRHREARRRVVATGKVERVLVALYASTNLSDGLVELDGVTPRRKAALYSPSCWRVTGSAIPLSREVPLIRTEGRWAFSESNLLPPLLRSREKTHGTEFWNDPALAVRRLPKGYEDAVTAACSSFYEIAERLVGLEEEAVQRAIHRWRRLRRHEQSALDFMTEPRGVGGMVVFVIDGDDGVPHVLLHHRSSDVATNPGLWCVTPTYVVMDPRCGPKPTALGVELHNVVRELLEEAYREEDVTRARGKTDPDWFLKDTAHGPVIAAGLRSGAISALHLGWCVDLLNGLLNSMTLLHVTGDTDLCRQLRDGVDASRQEVAEGAFNIKWVPLHSADLDVEMHQPWFHSGSALAIQAARGVLHDGAGAG